ncbi:hypothetical protein UA45_11905, partial [Morganella morganii]
MYPKNPLVNTLLYGKITGLTDNVFIIMAQFYSQPRQTPRQSRTVTVTADSLDALGQGIARLQGKTVFIPDLMPGESAQVRLTEEKRHYAKGSVDDVLFAVYPKNPLVNTLL